MTQTANPFTSLFSAFGSQFGIVNINPANHPTRYRGAGAVGRASYGRQLGHIGDVLEVLLTHSGRSGPDGQENRAIDDMKRLLADIADVKERKRRSDYLNPRSPT